MYSRPHRLTPRKLSVSPSYPGRRAALAPEPAPSSPRHGVVQGPLTTTTVTTRVVQEEVPSAEGDARCHSDRVRGFSVPASLRYRGREPVPRHPRRAASTTNVRNEADLRELRQTRSLFLCGRGLLSLRHIQHLPDMLSLRFLSAHMNNIKALDSRCLCTLRHLVELDLSANELRDIPERCWEGLGHLRRLNLSSNQLAKLGPTDFCSLISLQWLSLGFNNIQDISGLRSVPASAPLAYVDLCANRIETLDEVIDALSLHQAHLQELRLESPSSRPSMVTTATGAGVLSSLATTSGFLGDSEGAAAAHWLIHENPCCFSPFSAMQGASGDTSGSIGANDSYTTPTYVERLLSSFPFLLVVNGVSYGVDPLHALRQQRPSQKLGAWAAETRVAEVTTPVADTPPLAIPCNPETSTRDHTLHPLASSQGSVGKFDDDSIPPSEQFSRLLRRQLLHLRRSSSSSSGSTSSDSLKEADKRHRSHDRRRSHSRSRRRKSSRCCVGTSSPLSSSSRQASFQPSRRSAAGGRDAGEVGPSSEGVGRAVKRPGLAENDSKVSRLSPVEMHHRDGGRTITVDTANRQDQPPQRVGRRTAVVKPRRASLRRRSSSNTSLSVTSPLSGIVSSPSVVSPSAAHDRPSDQRPQMMSSSPSTVISHARKLRFEAVAAEASYAPSGTLSSGQPVSSADKGSDTIPLASPSPAGVTDTSDLSPPPAVAGTVLSVAVKERFSVDPSPPFSGTGPVATLQWKPKQISRGTSTDFGAEAPSTLAREAELMAQVEQLQEHLALRTTTINDLRRHLHLTRTQYVEEQREAQHRQRQLRSQVSALKDELARRGEEMTIVQRKQQVQLNRAVESVKAEWVRRHKESEALRAEAATKAAEAWEECLARVEKEKLHAQQTLTVKAAELATLERQIEAMWADMQAMRDGAATQQRNWSARTRLLLLEAEQRSSLESAAAASRALLSRVFHEKAMRLYMEALYEADRCRERAEEALREQRVAWCAQMAAYEDALRHAASEVIHAVAGGHKAVYAASLPPSPTLPDGSEEPPMTQAAAPSTVGGDMAAPQSKPLPHRDHSDNRQAICVREDTQGKNPIRECAPLTKERSAADDSALLSAATAVSHHATREDDSNLGAATVCGAIPDARMRIPDEPTEGSVAGYWKSACERVEAQLRRVEAALHVATRTQQTMAAENTRLLNQAEALETEKQEAVVALQSSSSVAAQERENLLRTLHTLRADMEKKDAALDALEEEAHEKLNEKRHRIAELEGAMEELSTKQTRTTEVNASMREELEAARTAVERLQQELSDAKERCKTVTHLQTEQVPDLERKQRELSELLATRNVEAHQHQLEKGTLVHTLIAAREQLVRLHESHAHLLEAHASAKEQVTRLQAELDTAKRQVSDLQEATRAKKKATLEVLSHLMASDAL